MLDDPGHFPVIEPGATHAGRVESESERVNQMQRRPDVGAKADHIARIRRNLRLIQDQVEHDN